LKLRKTMPPVWLMGMTNATFGMYIGFAAISLPQLLAEQHLPEAQVTRVTALCFSPLFWSFLVSPMLDVRYSRRRYAALLAAGAAIALCVAVMHVHQLGVFEGALIAGVAMVNLSSNALFGWLSSVLPKEEDTRVSAWANVANIGGSGVMVIAAGECVQRLPLTVAAVLLGVLVMLPTLIYPLIPAPGPDRRLAKESFVGFFRELLQLLGQRKVVFAIAMFALPSASFALANVVGGLGDLYHASVHTVSLVGGVGIVIAGTVGSLVYPRLTRVMALRPLYLAIGVVGACFSLCLLAVAHTPVGFVAATLGENTFQALAITGAFAIQFETVGQDNPLAATAFSVLYAALNVSTTYMIWIDGQAFARHGVQGSYATDAALGLTACLLLAVALRWLGDGERGRKSDVAA
jgi:PAT family beta-lactamase induction signal transducer AmpG